MSIQTQIDRISGNVSAALSAIAEKGVTVPDGSNSDALAELITSIKQGGGGTICAASAKDVNFYDYDGTLLYAYTLDEAHALTALPDGPAHAGLVFDGWNWALEKVQSLTRPMNIGAMYSTDDGTTRIYIRLEDGRTSPMLGICPKGTVTVDWGDGTDPDVLTGTSLTTVKWTPTHNYAAPGDYVIRLTVDGSAQLYGESYNLKNSCILRYSTGADYRNKIYHSAIRKVEVGNGVVYIGESAFEECYSLSSITIPAGVTSLGDHVFRYCYSLSSVTIPSSITSIGAYMFNVCYSISSITIPSSVTSIGNFAFSTCSALSTITLPAGVTSLGKYAFREIYAASRVAIPAGVTSLRDAVFYNCYGIKYYDFTRHTAVPSLSNTNVFTGIAADCEIRVPAALADEWKAATNWATYADYIVGV